MEPFGRRVTEYRVSILHKDQKVNAGKYKVMIGSSDGNCKLWKVTWGKRVQANTVKCTVCKRWIHKRFSGVRGKLSLIVDGFRCNRCDSRSPICLFGKEDLFDKSEKKKVTNIYKRQSIKTSGI